MDNRYYISVENLILTDLGIFLNLEGAYLPIQGVASDANGLYAISAFEETLMRRRAMACLKCGECHNSTTPCRKYQDARKRKEEEEARKRGRNW